MLIKKILLLQMLIIGLCYSSGALCGNSLAAAPTPLPPKAEQKAQLSEVIFAGGCFWCMEPPFEKLDGVSEVISGYAGGKVDNPTYEQVSSGQTGHLEVVLVKYDPAVVKFDKLMEVFWRSMDPTDAGGSFADRGEQYTSAVFVKDAEQRAIAERSKSELDQSKRFERPVVTPIREWAKFYAAEEYHQDYSKKNPLRYKYYRYGSGRDRFIEKYWGSVEKK